MDRHQPLHRSPLRGLTLTEVLISTAATAVLLSIFVTQTGSRRGEADAQAKLALLGQANACYAADWNDRQWTALPYDALSTCTLELNRGCIPQQILGRGPGGPIWGYYLGGAGRCSSEGWPGSCGNYGVYVPIDFAASTGAMRLPNVVGFREYVARTFYTPEFYAEDDPGYAVAETHFDATYEFNYDFATGAYADASFWFSPAAMLNPQVLRARANGGFQAYNAVMDPFRAPSVSQCQHPDLKTRMCEYGWFRGAPEGQGTSAIGFTASRSARPVTLFFDGSVQAVDMGAVQDQDWALFESSPTDDGLWSRDTPFGKDGWRLGNNGDLIDGRGGGFHFLTTGGILGRDLLDRGTTNAAQKGGK
jgi:hypothetical protein